MFTIGSTMPVSLPAPDMATPSCRSIGPFGAHAGLNLRRSVESRAASVPFHRRPEPAERDPNGASSSICERRGDPLPPPPDRGRAARTLRLAAPQRRLAKRQTTDRPPAKESVDPLARSDSTVLNFDRRRALDPQHQRRRLATAIRIGAAIACASARRAPRCRGPTISGQWVTISRDANPWRAKLSPRHLFKQFGQRPRVCCRGACSRAVALPSLANQYDASRNIGSAKRARARGEPCARRTVLLAWYDRHRRDLPWRARAGRAPRSLSGLAVGDHAAADDGAGGRALLRALPRSLARRWSARRGGARRRAQALGRARLLRARPQPACLRQGRGRAARRAISAHARRSCASCRASAPTPRRRSRRSRSMRRATPVDGNIERVITRLFASTRRAAGRQAGDPALGERR